ncbi:MAG: hypothetical protein F6J93_09470 [Oscillatoria sp. SIO1A7]|nr:hypothetical protein [Oscillatoria sp. SIO1A7]
MGGSPAEIWQGFIQEQLKNNSKIGNLFKDAEFRGYKNKILTLCFADEDALKKAKGQLENVKQKLLLLLPCDCIKLEPCVGSAPASVAAAPSRSNNKGGDKYGARAKTPLMALKFEERTIHAEKSSRAVLEAAAERDTHCQQIYQKLCDRTRALVEPNGQTLSVLFDWRLRVGGTRGFVELLLPVFHPVFGIPYIPASSLKGAARAWAKENSESRVRELLGMLDGKTARAAKVEFLDAFPTEPCLSVDVATPQWSWKGDRVTYKPEPHPLLTMYEPTLLIGLRPASNGTADDVNTVKTWLANALYLGIGSRTSAGYGRRLGASPSSKGLLSKDFKFELWTQGMYGADPKGNSEFRPTALRGILRYWFRAMAIALYGSGCQELEKEIFGDLGEAGKLSIRTATNPSKKENPYLYDGRICFEVQQGDEKYLALAEMLLALAASLGGFGRGSRRPLHLLNGRMRGCHWEVKDVDFPLSRDRDRWQQFFKELTAAFKAVRSPLSRSNSSPGTPYAKQSRYQDVLDDNAQIWLLECPNLPEPDDVDDWGNKSVRGDALNLLYGNPNFKGVNRDVQEEDIGAKVGGARGTPSFVWIKSVFPGGGENPYQVVSIFGANDKARREFAQALQEEGAMLVFGKEPEKQVKQLKQVKQVKTGKRRKR